MEIGKDKQTRLVGPPDARKRACPVRGALDGNLLLKGSKALSFDSIRRWPGSPAQGGGSPAATGLQPLR